MNYSSAIMLVKPDEVRAVRVEYDPDNKYNNNPMKVFKTVDPSIQVGDLVIAQTNTRHKFTVVKVSEVDFPVDFNDQSERWGCIGAKFDIDAFNSLIKIEDGVIAKVAKIQENRMRKELIDSMGLGNVSFDEVQLRRIAPASPDGVVAAEPTDKINPDPAS